MENAKKATIAMERKNQIKKEIAESTKLSLVHFKTDWNGASQIVSMIYDDLANSYKGTVDFHTVDFEADPTLATEYGVAEVPTILFFRHGKIIDHAIGMVPKNVLITKIENALSN